jgi:16S rRNA (cytidine1402-2'-O)-methyltransferase
VTIVIAGAASGEGARAEPEERLEAELARRVVAGEAPTAIAREVARARGLKRAEVYAALQKIKGNE